MVERIWIKILLYLFLFLSFPSYARGQANYAPGEVIVKLKSSVSSGKSAETYVGKVVQQKGMSLKSDYSRMGIYHFAKPGQKVEDMIAELKADPEVEYVEPNYIFSKASVGEASQTLSLGDVAAMAGGGGGGYLATGANIQVPSAWSNVTNNGTPVIGVIDTGLDINHAVFTGTGALWVNSDEVPGNGIDDDGNGYVDDRNGFNFVSNSGTMIDDDGHGTHVAGIILSVTQDIYNTPYPAAKIRIMPLKFLDGSGYGKTSDAIEAIYYGVNNGATILNNSWGGSSYSAALHEAIAYAYDHGVSFVAAAGNMGSNNDNSPMYPASYDVPNVIAVAATLDNDNMAFFSNYGKSSVQLASPGVYILSTIPGNGFQSMSGTSMAAPFVAGMAALMKIEKPNLLAYQIRDIIKSNTDITYNGSGQKTLLNKVETEGRLNVNDTLIATKAAVVDPSQPAYSFVNQDRALASSIAGGGCGLVKKMIDKGDGFGDGSGGPESWSVLVLIAILAIPMLVINVLRRKTPEQRRKHERFKINTDVKVNIGDRELIGAVSSISMGGVQIDTNAMLEKGGIITMSIRSPDGKEVLEVEGRVVWSEAQKSYGVQFAETAERAKEQLANWTSRLAKESGS